MWLILVMAAELDDVSMGKGSFSQRIITELFRILSLPWIQLAAEQDRKSVV